MDDERIIAAVEEYPVIYDKRHPKNRSRDYVRSCWEEIADELGLGYEVEAVKRRWGYLRDYFMRHAREMKRNPDQADKKVKWTLYENMLFLNPYLHLNDSNSTEANNCGYGEENTGDMPVTVKEMVDQTMFTENEDDNLYNPVRHEPPQYTSVPKKKKKLKHHGQSNLLTSDLDNSKFEEKLISALKSNDVKDDDDDHFFKSLKPMLQTLSGSQKLDFRCKVMSLISEYTNGLDT